MTSRFKLHHLPQPAPKRAHPSLQPGAQARVAVDAHLLHRQKNNEHHLVALTALSTANHRARTS